MLQLKGISNALMSRIEFCYKIYKINNFSWWPCISSNEVPLADSSPVVSKLSLLINYLLGKRLGYARGEDGKASIPFVKEPVLVFHAEY